jgi:tRNA dimethylallyltransferase
VATQPLIVIVGETASGKSALGIELAHRFGGEIICADSRTVYKGMDIGTAKPSTEERQQVPHHILDVVAPDQRYTVADFKQQANQVIDGISNRGKVPIMVGGTGLYVDAVIFDYTFSRRTHARDPVNPRHLLKDEDYPKQTRVRENTLIIGITLPREELRQRVINRVDAMVQAGFIKEVEAMGNRYGWDAPALQAPGYKAFREYISGAVSLDVAKARFIKGDLDLAKRQRTWFKRNKSIHWLSDPRKAVDIATTFLSKTQ